MLRYPAGRRQSREAPGYLFCPSPFLFRLVGKTSKQSGISFILGLFKRQSAALPPRAFVNHTAYKQLESNARKVCPARDSSKSPIHLFSNSRYTWENGCHVCPDVKVFRLRGKMDTQSNPLRSTMTNKGCRRWLFYSENASTTSFSTRSATTLDPSCAGPAASFISSGTSVD